MHFVCVGAQLAGLKALSNGRSWDIDNGRDLTITEGKAVTQLLLRVSSACSRCAALICASCCAQLAIYKTNVGKIHEIQLIDNAR